MIKPDVQEYKEYCKAKKISICKVSSMIKYYETLQKIRDFEKELNNDKNKF